VSWKEEFCIGSSGTMYPNILGIFFWNFLYMSWNTWAQSAKSYGQKTHFPQCIFIQRVLQKNIRYTASNILGIFLSRSWNIWAQSAKQRATVRRPHLSNRLLYMFLWEPSVMKSRFLLSNISHTGSLNPVMFFFNLQMTCHYFDLRVHPEGNGIVMDIKLLNKSS